SKHTTIYQRLATATIMNHLGGVRVGSTLAASSIHGNVDESSVVLHATVSTAGELLLLLLLLNLGSLSTDLSSTSERTVHLASKKAGIHCE
ncbi:hypothetical protein PMAYCL1PPCAC_27522, partial [Pristionchus mayeri]